MTEKYTTSVREVQAIEFTLRTEHDIAKYKEAWHVLHHHAREYPELIYRVSTNADSDILVLANPDSKKFIREYLECYGEVINEEMKLAVVVDVKKNIQQEDYTNPEILIGRLC